MQRKEQEQEQTFQLQALEINEPDANFDPQKMPQTGEEYLTHMMYERKRCPAVVTKKYTKAHSSEIQNHNSLTMLESLPLPPHRCLLPTPEWQDAQVASFKAARSRVLSLREELSAQKYDQSIEPPLTTDRGKWQEFCKEQQPLLSTLLRLSQIDLEHLLEMYTTWLSQLETDGNDNDNGSNNNHNNIDLLRDVWLARWLYATLVCLHLPLEPYVFSTLRCIARSCIELRNQLASEELDRAAPYNLIITLIVHVFAQTDLKTYL